MCFFKFDKILFIAEISNGKLPNSEVIYILAESIIFESKFSAVLLHSSSFVIRVPKFADRLFKLFFTTVHCKSVNL